MRYLRLVLAVVLLTTFPSVYGGDCFDGNNFDLNTCQREAEQGDADAQFNLALMYGNGRGVLQDYKEAVKWYRKAAEQGDAQAQFNLGNGYKDGQGVLQDYKEACKWYRLAAKQGSDRAQNNLAAMYANGQGVLKDFVMAHMYWNIAAVSGNKNAIKFRGIVEEDMTPSQIAEAQKLAREWVQKHQ